MQRRHVGVDIQVSVQFINIIHRPLAQVMREFLRRKHYDENYFNMFATMELLRPWYDHTAQFYFIEEGQKKFEGSL